MDIKEFRQLSRQNNYIVTHEFYDTLYIKRHSEILAVISLTKTRNRARFINYPPKLSESEFNLIKEFTHND